MSRGTTGAGRDSGPRLVLVNGVPGSGKSTAAAAVAARRPMALALDIDQLKHSLGGWAQDLHQSGLQARRLALALVREQFARGHDVVVGQFLAKVDFIEQLEATAHACGGTLTEFLLEVPPARVAERLAGRAAQPSRPEHVGNDRFVGPQDAERLVALFAGWQAARPGTVVVDASGAAGQVADSIAARLGWG